MKIAFMETPSPWLVRQGAQTALGILYIATIVKQSGYEVRMFKPKKIEGLDDILNYDILCMSGTTLEYVMNVECAKYLKSKNPDIKIFIGGSHASILPKDYIDNPLFDSVCVGEGESLILQMIKDYENNTLKKSYHCTHVEDINDIPIPDRTLIPGSHGGNIFANNKNYIGGGNENFITSRGCPFNCSFCASKSLWDSNLRFRSIENIKKELDYIHNKCNIKQLRICDDNITSNRKKLIDLCKALKDYGFVWRCSVRAESLTPNNCKVLSDGGCKEISVGIESGDQRVLDYLNKKTSVEKMLSGCKNAHDIGITVRALFMIGTPGERKDTPEINMAYIDKLDYDLITLSTFIPLPGTDIFNSPDKFNCEILTKDYSKYNKDYYNSGGIREYEPLIWNKFLTIDEQKDNVKRMENYIHNTGKYNTG
jgi:radical SAM superfamily enzyme YgiQ (UPF0313 family)